MKNTPRAFRLAVSCSLAAAALALVGIVPFPSVASPSPDFGLIYEDFRLSHYPLREPEQRVWGRERAKDAVLVGQLENRLYLYRYVRETEDESRLDFRSQPLVIDPDSWQEPREERVSVTSPSKSGTWYLVEYHYGVVDKAQFTGFLVDETGNAIKVVADATLAVLTSSQPWNEARKAQAVATLPTTLRTPPAEYFPRNFPTEMRFEQQQKPVDITARFLALHKVTRAIPLKKSVEFGRALSDLRRFVLEHDYREIDPDDKNPAALTALNDYGFWLVELGDAFEADRILSEVLRRDPSRTVGYLNRADARWKQREKATRERTIEWRDYLEALAREDYRLYCSRRLAAGEAIPSNITQRIETALNVSSLNAETCRPQLVIFTAIQNNDLEAVRAELAAGQDPNGENEKGISALAVATSLKQLDTVRVLLAAGAKADIPQDYPLLARALPDSDDQRPAAERYALADMLIAAGAPVDALRDGDEPLLMWIVSFSVDGRDNMNYLLDRGANPNGRAKNGRSVLHAAMGSPRTLWFAEKLLARGADINATYIWVYYGDQAMWETPLLEALREARNNDSTSATAYKPSERVSFALSHGADPAVGGYASPKAPERNGLKEALSLTSNPALVKLLTQAAEKWEKRR